MDGFTAARAIRTWERDRLLLGGKPTPIVPVTALSSADVQADCAAAGMQGFVVKPVDRQVLLDTIKRFLDHADT